MFIDAWPIWRPQISGYGDFHQGQSWLTGTIVRCSGPVSYEVKTDNGQLICNHQDQSRKRSIQPLSWHNDSVTDDHQINRSPPPPQQIPLRLAVTQLITLKVNKVYIMPVPVTEIFLLFY